MEYKVVKPTHCFFSSSWKHSSDLDMIGQLALVEEIALQVVISLKPTYFWLLVLWGFPVLWMEG